MLTHPVFSTMLPVLACAALRSISRLITLVLLNAVCIVPLFFMKGGFPAAFCLPYLVPLVAFGVSTCLTARFLRQHSTGLCPLWKVVAGFLVLMLCFYLWVGRYIDIAQSEGDIVGALMAIILYVCLYHPALSLVTQIVFSRKVKQRTFFWIPSAMSFLLGTLFPILDFPDSVYPEALYASIVFLVSMTVGFFISFCSVGRKRGIDNVSKNE
jgi:hypothetical protein